MMIMMMQGDNRYRTDQYGLQDAKMGIEFVCFPPVLHVQLKRFEFDMVKAMDVKLNDRFEFPENLDLSRYCPSMAPDDLQYTLWAVLVHCGGVHGGHYYVFIRSYKNNEWYRLDDDTVEPATRDEALDENFGVDFSMETRRRPRASSNAYMLVYVRNNEKNKIIFDMKFEEIPSELHEMYVIW